MPQKAFRLSLSADLGVAAKPRLPGTFLRNMPTCFLMRWTCAPSPPVIIDEIQNVPQLMSYIKARIDGDKKPGQWIVTGSQQWTLMKGISETLAGRIAVLHLHPFSITEIQRNIAGQPATVDGYMDYLYEHPVLPDKALSLGKWMHISGEKEPRSLVISTSKDLGPIGYGVKNIHFSLL